MNIQYQHSIGLNYTESVPTLPFKLSDHPHFTFNSPVGLCSDRYNRIWVADTGNNRIVIVDQSLSRVLQVFGTPGGEAGQFNMPFRLLHHPEKSWIYVSDLANRRIQILQYSRNLTIKTIALFGNSGPANNQLQGPNGLAFCEGKLCVADEFYVNEEGGGRVAIFSEDGTFLSDIQTIEGATDPGLLWPQGLSSDSEGLLYIANTGFYNIVRCDLNGKGVPFPATGTPEIDDLDLSRDASVIGDTIYIPGGYANQICRYTTEGERLAPLGQFFAPIQVIPHPKNKQQLIVSEPILATINLFPKDGIAPLGVSEKIAGPPRNNPGQFYFVTSAITETIRAQKTKNEATESPSNANHLGEFNPFNPLDWMNTSLKLWTNSWGQWMDLLFNGWFPQGPKPKNLREDAWLLDGANRQIKRSTLTTSDASATAESLFPLMPGALGIDAFHPKVKIPGQVAPGTALFLVTNYLSGFVSVLQYNPYLDDLVHFTYFGGYGSEPWQLKKPQGIAVNDHTGDIYIADSGNHRIAHWRISKAGIIGFINTYGSQGDGDGEFSNPSDVAVDSSGQLYVADQMNNRIQVLDEAGQYRYQFGQQGYGENNDRFLLPTSIQASEQHLFVNDLVNRSLKMFTQSGEFITSFSGLGAHPGTGQLWMPYLLHAHNGHLIVPDCATNQVHLYRYTDDKTTI